MAATRLQDKEKEVAIQRVEPRLLRGSRGSSRPPPTLPARKCVLIGPPEAGEEPELREGAAAAEVGGALAVQPLSTVDVVKLRRIAAAEDGGTAARDEHYRE